jgi:hypothetical protein
VLLKVKLIELVACLAVDALILQDLCSHAVGMRCDLASTRPNHLGSNPQLSKISRFT